MGQKVNPHGLRVGVIKDWDSRWYADADFADCLVEDYNIRKDVYKRQAKGRARRYPPSELLPENVKNLVKT